MRRTPAALAVFLLAVAARGALLLAAGPGSRLVEDEREYAAVAGSLARGEGFGFDAAGLAAGGAEVRARLVAFRAPLLPLVLAPVHALTGGSPAALRTLSCLVGALAAPLALGLALRAGAGPRAAAAAGVAVALWPSHAWLSVRVLSEGLDSVLLLAAADLLIRRRHAAAGAALGLAVLCRPGGLPSVALVAAVVPFLAAPGVRLRAAATVLFAAAAVVAPWALRNASVLGRPVLVTSSGVTMLGGNCDASLVSDFPGKWRPPSEAWTGAGAPDLGMYGWSALGEDASDARFAAAAREWAASDPGRAARLAGWKAVRFLDPDQHSEKPDARWKALLGWISWGPALLVVAAALAAGCRARGPAWWIAAAMLAGHLATALVAYGDARARAPVEPVLLALLAAPFVGARVAKWTGRGDEATVEA